MLTGGRGKCIIILVHENMSEKAYTKELVHALRAAENNASLEAFLRAILTPSELEEIAKRLQIVKLLAGGMPQREVARRLDVGIATVTRGSRELRDKKSGFHPILSGMSWRWNEARDPVRR